jgi:hypothetical protein
MVYVREAHPADGWQMEANEKDDVIFAQPTTLDERRAVATACCERLEVAMPAVLDDMNDTVDTLYAGWPERIYIVNADGRIAYAGRRGPWGFKPDDVRAWLERSVR